MNYRTLGLSVLALGLLLGSCANPAGGDDDDDQKSDVANLSGIALSAGTLSPIFDEDVTDYVVLLTNDIATITVSGTASEATATMGGDSGQAKGLAVGANTIILSVTAQNGTTTKDYTVTVYRNGAAPADIAATANMGKLIGVPSGAYRWTDDYGIDTYHIGVVKQSFHMSQYEVTRAQWRAIMGGAANDPSTLDPAIGDLSEPVRGVNWYHAIAYCNLLSIAEGLTPVYSVSGVDFTDPAFDYTDIPSDTDSVAWKSASIDWNADGYRLPTYIEWVWAALGADDTHDRAFAGSTGSNSLGDCVWSEDNCPDAQIVGLKDPNALDLYDMSGNVEEWSWNRVDMTSPATDMPHTIYSDDDITMGRGDPSGDYRMAPGFFFMRSYDSDDSITIYQNQLPIDMMSFLGFRVVRN